MTSAQESDASEVPLTPVQFRRVLGISSRTLQRWVAKGLVEPAFRTPLGHARYTSAEVAAAKGLPVPDEDADVDPEEDDETENADDSALTA
jgi:MerR HTH family regulatory protein